MTGLDMLMPQTQSNQLYGVTIGVVTNNQDPDNLGRIKVKFPWLSDQQESAWARLLSPMAGKDRGFYCLPEVDDEVLVAFEHGQVEFPYILGSLWNGKDKPPSKNSDGKNNQRLIKSRSGHVIILDDTNNEEKIIIRDKTAKNEIVIDSKQNSMTIKVDKDLTIETKGNISLKSSGGDVAIECKNLKIQAQQSCDIKANVQCNIEANAGMGLKCMAGVKINDGALEVM
jgi:uncharacterized protein involved in type VI secretion and phage assembly